MVDEGEKRTREWLASWQDAPVPEAALNIAAGGAHAAVRSLDRAAATLDLDDEPWRLKTLLRSRSRR